jgi:L-cystine uptake protein TcyP (sodium:dicarboxylate symporter family)
MAPDGNFPVDVVPEDPFFNLMHLTKKPFISLPIFATFIHLNPLICKQRWK